MKLPEFFGLDIGSSAIRMAQVNYNSFNKPEITVLGQLLLDNPIQNLKDQATKDYVVKKIIEAKERSGIKTTKVVAALPEAMIFSKPTVIPNLAEDEIENLLFYELKNHIPVSPSEVQKDYINLGIDPNNPKLLKILLIAAPKMLVELYSGILTNAGLEPLALETETVAVARIMGNVLDLNKAVLVADFGHKGVDLCLLKKDKILFSQSIGTGSEALSRALAMDYGIDMQQADQYKMKAGLLKDQANGKVLLAMTPIMHIISNEINKVINYLKSNMVKDMPEKIYFVGDGAKLLGLEEYMRENVTLPCEKLDPVSKIDMPGKYSSEFAKTSTMGFTLAVGLAMKQE